MFCQKIFSGLVLLFSLLLGLILSLNFAHAAGPCRPYRVYLPLIGVAPTMGGGAPSGNENGSGCVIQADFNNDGYLDLTIGVPNEDVGAISDAGAVNVLYGSANGLTIVGKQIWNQTTIGSVDPGEAGDNFGQSLALGDFNNDGYADIAIGTPFEDIGPIIDAGAVQVLYGSPDGLVVTNSQFWHQDVTGIASTAATGENFGRALSAGDFNNDTYTDLAIGIPNEDIETASDAGAIQVIYGSGAGLRASGSQFLHQNTNGVTGEAATGSNFGRALSTGDFNFDSFADLAIGVPNEDVNTVSDAGMVQVLYGSGMGLTTSSSQAWHQDSAGVGDAVEVGDNFGRALSAGDFNNDNFSDLVIGVPVEDVNTLSDAGMVHILYGSTTGLMAAGSQVWDQSTVGVGGGVKAGNNFGYTFASGDFNKDTYSDLAIGVPNEDIGAASDAGTTYVLSGSRNGLTANNSQVWDQDSPGVANAAEMGDNLGRALSAGDFDNDGFADLAIAVPFEDIGIISDAGMMHVLYGSVNGLTAVGSQTWDQNTIDVTTGAEMGDVFGGALR